MSTCPECTMEQIPDGCAMCSACEAEHKWAKDVDRLTDTVATLEAKVAVLESKLEASHNALLEAEWSGEDFACPICCGRELPDGHREGCELKAGLTAVES